MERTEVICPPDGVHITAPCRGHGTNRSDLSACGVHITAPCRGPRKSQKEERMQVNLLLSSFYLFVLFVIPLGFEPKTHSLEGCCSIQLSYGTIRLGVQR